MIIATMITPPFEWKPIVSSKQSFKSDPCQSTRRSMLPSITCIDPNGKIRETFPVDKTEQSSVEKCDWKYKCKTGDLMRIPLSHIISDSDENDVLDLNDKKLDCLNLRQSNEACSVRNENLAVPTSVKRGELLSKMSQNDCKPSVLTVPMLRSRSAVNISSPANYKCGVLQDSVRSQHQFIAENQFGNATLADCYEIRKTKFENMNKIPFEEALLNDPILENTFRYKVNASELPRSKTPVNEKDPDRISFKKVASFLSDNLGSSISMDDKDQSDPETSAIEAVDNVPGQDVPNERSLEFGNDCPSESCLKLSENTEAMNLVNADVFTSPSRSVYSSGAFKVSLRLRRARNLGAKTPNEIDPSNVHLQNESKQRFKLQRFLDFAVSTRERRALTEGFARGASHGEFLRVPSPHSDYGKQRVCDTTVENSQSLISGCHIDMRTASASKVFSVNKDCETLDDISKRRQYAPASVDKRTDYKKLSVQKSKSDLGGVSVKDQTWQARSKSWKNSENGGSIMSGQSVIVIPACTSVANDDGKASDSGIISKSVNRTFADSCCRRPANRTNYGLNTQEKLNFASNLASVFSQQRNLDRNHQSDSDSHAHFLTRESKDYSPVKLTFRKEKIMSHRNSEFISKFFNSEDNKQKKMDNSVND